MEAKGKNPASPTSPSFAPESEMAGLSIRTSSPPQKPPRPAPPPRPAAPPRPSAKSKPSAQLLSPTPARAPAADSEEEDEDENDPFADHNAVVTPKVERAEPKWS